MTPSRFEALRADPEFAALLDVSARLGRDPLQVQAAGGNTSIKRDGAMWVKASGTWLAEADAKDIFAPIRQAELAVAVASGAAFKGADFVATEADRAGLRPSIETAVHAVMARPVVLHTHCVAAIAVAAREDAAAVAAERLDGLDHATLPYVMPGEPLARMLTETGAREKPVVILGNHGLVAAGETVAEAEATLREASRRLGGAAPAEGGEDAAALDSARYRAADAPALHAVARDPDRLALAAAGPFYPDHVVFLGPTLAVAEPGESVEDAADRLDAPPLILLPGRGAALRRDASPAQEAMARCLGDVIGRVDPGAPLAPLPRAEIAALLGWDAEKYRQSLSAGGA